MTNERLPQRFRYRKIGCFGWEFGACFPMVNRWSIQAGRGFGSFESDPWEILGHIIGDVAEVQWIDNDCGWAGDVMQRPDLLDDKSLPIESAGTRKESPSVDETTLSIIAYAAGEWVDDRITNESFIDAIQLAHTPRSTSAPGQDSPAP